MQENETLTDNFDSALFKKFRIPSFNISQRIFDKLINMINSMNLSTFPNLKFQRIEATSFSVE